MNYTNHVLNGSKKHDNRLKTFKKSALVSAAQPQKTSLINNTARLDNTSHHYLKSVKMDSTFYSLNP